MGFFDKEIDITRNIKMIEWLKSELLTEISVLFKNLVNGFKEDAHDILADSISNIIIVSYLLARRLGIAFNNIEMKIEKKLRTGIVEEHQLEKWYGDLSELSKHLNNNRDQKRLR